MATGDVFDVFRPESYVPQNGLVSDPNKLRTVGYLRGYPLKKVDNDGFYLIVRIPANGTPVPTGLTLKIATVDDPNNASVGLVYRLGISGARLISGTTNVGSVTLGTETTADVTAAATSGIITVTSMAITKANLNTVAASDEVLLYIRRIGTHANDTHTGEVLVLDVTVTDT
jgi:hypothetical protein